MKYLSKNFSTKLIAVTGILCSAAIYPSIANAGYFNDLTYYAGLSVGYQRVGFKPNFGQGFIPQSTVDYEYFVGAQNLHKFGFEIGLSTTPVVNKFSTLYAGDYYPGATRPLAAGTWQTWQPEYENYNIYFGINRYLQILASGKLRAFAFAGIAYAYVEVITNFIADDLPGLPDQDEQDAARDKFAGYNFIPMLKLGIEQNFTANFGWRFAYTWKNYAAFGKINSMEYPELSIGVKPQNTNALYLGLFITT